MKKMILQGGVTRRQNGQYLAWAYFRDKDTHNIKPCFGFGATRKDALDNVYFEIIEAKIKK